MNIDYPAQTQIDGLRTLWQEAFGDDDAFLELFYTYGFASDRCRCVTVEGRLAAALYWFDCSVNGQPLAYLYGVATGKPFQGNGLCRTLVENTHSHLKSLGYAGSLLVPADEALCRMYEKMGYSACTSVSEYTCTASSDPAKLWKLDALEYCQRRREFLPENGVVQEGDSMVFLQTMADFYSGEDFVVAVYRGDDFFAPELLGNVQSAPRILAALNKKEGRFRGPGAGQPFAMYHSLSDVPAPSYLGLAFD